MLRYRRKNTVKIWFTVYRQKLTVKNEKPSTAKNVPSCCVTAVKYRQNLIYGLPPKRLPSKKGKPSTAKTLPSCCVTVPSKSVKNIVTEHLPEKKAQTCTWYYLPGTSYSSIVRTSINSTVVHFIVYTYIGGFQTHAPGCVNSNPNNNSRGPLLRNVNLAFRLEVFFLVPSPATFLEWPMTVSFLSRLNFNRFCRFLLLVILVCVHAARTASHVESGGLSSFSRHGATGLPFFCEFSRQVVVSPVLA